MWIDVIAVLPEMFSSAFEYGVIGRARKKGLFTLQVHNLRDFTEDKHRQIDDAPYGGGPGMVLKPEPIFAAVRSLLRGWTKDREKVVLLTPQGKRLDQQLLVELSVLEHLILICGRYEGVDERVREQLVDEEISIGDYVLSGGEIPAMVIVDGVVRLLEGVVGSQESLIEESFQEGLLDYPQYTRPYDFEGIKVPDILLKGDHQRVKEWREKKARERTAQLRPDLLEKWEESRKR